MPRLSPHTQKLVEYYKKYYSADLDSLKLRDAVAEWKSVDSKGVSEYDLATVEYIDSSWRYYRLHEKISIDEVEKGVMLGHVASILFASKLASLPRYNPSDEVRLKILEGLSSIFYCDNRSLVSYVSEFHKHFLEYGSLLGLSFDSLHDLYDNTDLYRSKKPTALSLKTFEMPIRAFSLEEWVSIKDFIFTQLSLLENIGQKSGFTESLTIGRYEILFICKVSHCEFLILLPPNILYRCTLERDGWCGDFSNLKKITKLAKAIEKLIKEHKNYSPVPFLDPGLFIEDLKPRVLNLQKDVLDFKEEMAART